LCKLASTSQQKDHILLQLDVLFAMMTQVKLNRENKVSLMAGVKDFVNDHATQKKGYKILTRVIESFQLETLEELAEIKNEITPLMKG
jgi:predicted GNAT family acetyltransferase